MTDHPYEAANHTRDIVCSYVSHNAISAADLPGLIASTHRAVLAIEGGVVPDAEPVALTPSVPIKKRFTDTHVICLDDGLAFKSMRKHLTVLGMSPDQYRAKWGLPKDDPIVHPSYSAKRSALAKKSGLGRKK